MSNQEIEAIKFESIIEGIVRLMQSVDGLKSKIDKIDNRLSIIEQRQQTMMKSISDGTIMSNNTLIETEELRSEFNTIVDKLDNIDNDVKNIRIYKNVSSDMDFNY